MEDCLHVRTIMLRNKSRLLNNQIIRRIIKDFNAHRNEIQNAPSASHRPCRINVSEHSLEIYGHNNDPELSRRGLIHLLCVNLSEEISIRNNWYLFS